VDTVRELEYLQRLALTAAQTLDPPSLVRLVIAETTEAMGVDVCSVYLTEPGGRSLVRSATNGLSQGGVGRVRLRVGEGVTGTTAAERAPVVVDDVPGEPRFCWLAGVDQARFVSICSVPIISAGRLVGVLNVQTEEPHHFNRDEVTFMAAIAAQLAGALEPSGMQARLEAQVRDLRSSEEVHRRFTDLALTGGRRRGRLRGDRPPGRRGGGALRSGRRAHRPSRPGRTAGPLGHRLRQDMWVLVLEADEPAAARALVDGASAERVFRAVSEAAGSRHPGAIVVARAGTLVILVPGPTTAEEAEVCARSVLVAAGGATGGASFSCGIGGRPGGPAELHELMEQARLAVRVGRRLHRTGEAHPFRRLGVERLLLAVAPAGSLADFVEEWLGPLQRQEARGRSAAPLVATTEALVSVSWSPRAAARRRGVHVNTLLYRLQRARELTGRDLDDPDVRLALALALRARALLGAPASAVLAPVDAGRR